MRKILTILFVLIGFVANSQYTPSAHTPINKPIAPAGAFPSDARSYYYDAGAFTYRPYASTAEVLSYLNTTTKRSGRFPIWVTVGGVVKQYMFKNGTADGDLVEIVMLNASDTTRYVAIDSLEVLTDSTFRARKAGSWTTYTIKGGASSGGGSGISNITATDKTGISWSITNPTSTPNLDLSIFLNRMVKDSVVLATPVSNFYSLPANSTIVVFRALTANTAVDITTTGGVNSGTSARAGKPFIVANQDSVYKLILSPYSISDSGTVNDVAPRSWVMIVPIATQWYKVASGTFGQVDGVKSVALNVGTSGSDVNVTGSPITNTGTLTVNIPNADTTARGLITAARQQIGGSKLLTGTYTPSAKLSYNIAALGNHFATANNDTLVGIEVNPIFNALSFTGVLNYGLRSWPLQNLIGPIRTFSSTGNTYIGNNPISTTDGGYKLDVGGSIRGQLLRLNGPIGYGTNILEFTLNGNTTPIAAINNFGIWNISNGGTNTVAANTGVIGTLGQNTSSLLLGSQVNAFGITQWTGTAGTSSHTTLAGPYIIVPNGSGGTFSGLTIGGTRTAGVLTDGYLISLGHWSNGGVLAMGNTTGTQKYTVLRGDINVFVDQPNKTLEGFVWNPTITGSVALANHRAFTSASGANHGFGTLTPNNKAIAEFSDTLRGILPTRMTATQASAMSLGTGEAGMYTYVSTTNGTFPAAGFYYWSGTAWVAFSNTTASGTYTPTFFTGTNTTSVSSSGGGVFYYVRTANLVEVTGTVSASSSSTGAADFNLTIPIASDFTSIGDAQGVAINSVNGFGGNCSQNISADRVAVNYNANAGSNTINLKFTYIIR